jgi:hypothetical protein
VCQISDIGSAQRVGAALTYARRYALFTLVGIAGEDDLDAPDLGADPTPTAELPGSGRQSNGQTAAARPRPDSHRKRREPSAAPSMLAEQLSASLRESLIEQIAGINSADEAAAWAHLNLPAKNKLRATDAKLVEERFGARLSAISAADGDAQEPLHAVGKVIRSLGKPVRLRDKEHRRFVLRQACLVCGRVPSDPHHLTFTQPRALGSRASDEFTVPVCRVHHRELHRSGDEVAWWRGLNIDPVPVALRLWQQTRLEDQASARPAAPTQPNPAPQGARGAEKSV